MTCCPYSFSYILGSIVHSANIEIRECVKWSLTRGLRQWKIINRQAQKVAAGAYRRWSFTRDSKCKALTGKSLVFWIGGCLWEVVVYRGSTVFIHFFTLDDSKGTIYFEIRKQPNLTAQNMHLCGAATSNSVEMPQNY